MKNLFTYLLSGLFLVNTYGQADLTLNLLLYDNSSPPDSMRIYFGLDTTATDGIDTHLGEGIIPPDVCCGWGGDLCARFLIPSSQYASWKDFKFGELPFTGTKVHRIDYCASQSATQVTVVWNLPAGVNGTLMDPFNGQIFNIPISGSGSFIVAENLIGMRIILTLNYDNVVPVNLIAFAAEPIDNSVLISWQTTFETNNYGFEIERLKDYSVERLNTWERIGFIEGNGTTTKTHSYSFTDENISEGKIKYRLKQIDFDGSYTYSNEVETDVKITESNFVLYQNYPNPFNPATSIKFSVPEQTQLKINLYNVLGEFIQTIAYRSFEGGTHQITFNPENLTAGIYIYRMESDKVILAKMLILLK